MTAAASTSPQEMLAALKAGDPLLCGRLLTRIEADDDSLMPLLRAAYLAGCPAPVVGITGPPGVGKSTLVDALIQRHRTRAERVAVLAVDPSSPLSGGAMLGDRVRMARHNADGGVFVRSMASRGAAGGLAHAAGDALTLLAATGAARVLLETVGVGQNELEVRHHADTVVVLQSPAGGDAIQAIKAGLLEVGDVFVVNKSDLPGTDRVVAQLREAIENRRGPGDAWRAPVLAAQLATGSGVDGVCGAIDGHLAFLVAHPAIAAGRARVRTHHRIAGLLRRRMLARTAEFIEQNPKFEQMLDDVLSARRDPHEAAALLLDRGPGG